jgi:phosphatidylglycerol:prolipoprotein diacylglycerol transferase
MRATLSILTARSIDAFRLMQYLGALAGLALGAETMRRVGEDPNAFLVAGVLIFIPALVAAHIGPAVAAGDVHRDAWLLPSKGSAFFYALPIAAVCGVLAVWSLGLPVGRFLDSVAIGVAAGTIFGRLGCLLHGCCGGRPTSGPIGLWLMDADGVRARRIPTQLLDAAWALLLLIGLLVTVGRAPPGVLFFTAAVLYGTGRFVTDFTRQQRPPGRRLSDAQLGALVLVIAGCCALLSTILEAIP